MASRKGDTRAPVLDRLARRSVTQGECWVWTGAKNNQGYGQIGVNGAVRSTHRVAYEQMVGPIPVGLTLDHLCRTRLCWRPDHLEPVPGAVNTRRGKSPAAANGRRTHCTHGHPFTPENTYVRKDGRRQCRACNARLDLAQQRARREARIAAGLPVRALRRPDLPTPGHAA